MGAISTHVLDTAHGHPARGVGVTLYRVSGPSREALAETHTNADGRTDAPLLSGAGLTVGVFELVFAVGAYFSGLGVTLPDPPFLGEITLRFGVADAEARYHVPLLVSPWGYSTYRGS